MIPSPLKTDMEPLEISTTQLVKSRSPVSTTVHLKHPLTPYQESIVEARIVSSRLALSPPRKRAAIKTDENLHIVQIHAMSTLFSNLEQSIVLSASTLISIELKNCGIQNADIFSLCVNLRALCLGGNAISEVPEFSNLKRLQFLDMSSNRIRFLGHVQILRSGMWKLVCAKFSENPISTLTSYRQVFIENLRSLLVLDNVLILSFERSRYVIPNIVTLNLSVPESLQQIIPESSGSAARLRSQLDIKVKSFYRMFYATDPLAKLQKVWIVAARRMLHQRKSNCIIKVQAAYRGFAWRTKVHRELEQFWDIDVNIFSSPKPMYAEDFYACIIQRSARQFISRKRIFYKVKTIQGCFKKFIGRLKNFRKWATLLDVTGLIFPSIFLEEVLLCTEELNMHPTFMRVQINFIEHHRLHSVVENISAPLIRTSRRGFPKFKYVYKNSSSKLPWLDMPFSLRLEAFANINQVKALRKIPVKGVKCSREERNTIQLMIREKSIRTENVISDTELVADDSKYLYYLEKLLLRKFPQVAHDWSSFVVRKYSAVLIQKSWRAHKSRISMSSILLLQLLRRRASVVIQRWYRWKSSITKRFKLLKTINESVASIIENCFYIDAKIFYFLQKYPSFSMLTHRVRKFPEFRGIPVFEVGSLRFSVLDRYFARSKEAPKTIPLSENLDIFLDTSMPHLRIGPPKWCSIWNVPQSKEPTLSRRKATSSFQSLFQEGCTMNVTDFYVSVPSETSGYNDSVHLKLVKLTFGSTKEARIRAAMMMLSTFDPLAQSCLEIFTHNIVLQRISSIESRVIEDSLSMKKEELLKEPSDLMIFPVESRILLGNYCPRYYILREKFDVNDCVKFRYFLDAYSSLSGEQRPRTKLRIRSANCRYTPSAPRSLDSVASAMVTKLEISQQSTLKEKETFSKPSTYKLPEKISLVQFDGNVTYIPPEYDAVEYFNSTTAKKRYQNTAAHATKQFKERLQSPTRTNPVFESTSDILLPEHSIAAPSLSMYSYYEKHNDAKDLFALPFLNSTSLSSNRPKTVSNRPKPPEIDTNNAFGENREMLLKKEKIAKEKKRKETVKEHRQFANNLTKAFETIIKQSDAIHRKTTKALNLHERKKLVDALKKKTGNVNLVVENAVSTDFLGCEQLNESEVFDLSHDIIPMHPKYSAGVVKDLSPPGPGHLSIGADAIINGSRASFRKQRFSAMRDSFDTEYLVLQCASEEQSNC